MSPIIDLSQDFENHNGSRLVWEVVIGGYRYELFSNNHALVYKGEATKHSYEITVSGCNCPSALYGKHPCKHEAPLAYKGDGVESVVAPDSDDSVLVDDAGDILSDLLG